MPLFRRAAPQEQVEEKTEVALARTRRSWFGRIGGILDRGKIDDELWDELEEVLLGADVGLAHGGESPRCREGARRVRTCA